MKYLLLFMAICFCSCTEQKLSLDIHSFQKPPENPILSADSSFLFVDPISGEQVRWQRADVFNPAAIIKGDTVMLLFRAEDNPAAAIGGRTSRLGLAKSTDGVHFTKMPQPVLYPDNDDFKQFEYPGGCEDPRLVQRPDGKYIVAYTAWNSKTARLSIAISDDLIHWEKKGPAFLKAQGGKYADSWSKSASMLTEFVDGKQVLAKINGKYWMYWGENFINLAWSDNGYEWNPSVDAADEMTYVALPRPGKFDSHLTECGPPAILMDKGVVLLYNGKNMNDDTADPNIPKGMYAVGQIIFDKKDLSTIIQRSDEPFMKPTLPHEITGQYKAGTTFSEGLVRFKNQWWMYYGTADSYVGLAIGADEK